MVSRILQASLQVFNVVRPYFIAGVRFLVDLSDRILKLFRKPQLPSVRYRYLARQIAMELVDVERARVLLFSSCESFEDSNDIVLMFAHFLHDELESRVLVIDGTFRKEAVSSRLELSDRPGFIDLLTGSEATLEDLVVQTGSPGVMLLPVGQREEDRRYGAISRDAIVALLEQTHEQFDYVLIQQGPIVLDSRYMLFTRFSDLVLWHIGEGSTRQEAYEECHRTFRDHGVENTRLILSD